MRAPPRLTSRVVIGESERERLPLRQARHHRMPLLHGSGSRGTRAMGDQLETARRTPAPGEPKRYAAGPFPFLRGPHWWSGSAWELRDLALPLETPWARAWGKGEGAAWRPLDQGIRGRVRERGRGLPLLRACRALTSGAPGAHRSAGGAVAVAVGAWTNHTPTRRIEGQKGFGTEPWGLARDTTSCRLRRASSPGCRPRSRPHRPAPSGPCQGARSGPRTSG